MTKGLIGIGESVHASIPQYGKVMRQLLQHGPGAYDQPSDELNFIKEKGIKVISMNNLLLDIENACDTIMEFSNGKELYVSIDIDVIDPVFAPATGYRTEVGGLTSRQFLYLIQRINKIKNLRAVDIVEINPEKDKDNLTIKLGSKILAELI